MCRLAKDRKTMNKKLLLVVVALAPALGFAQTAVPQILRTQQAMDRINTGALNGIQNSVFGIPATPGRMLGTSYLDSKWNKGSIMLTQNETLIEGYPLKYDVKERMLEIKGRDGIRILDIRKVKSLMWIDSLTQQPAYFVNASAYKSNGTPLVGLIEVVSDGKLPLLCFTKILVKESNYNAALDVGDRDSKIYKKYEFYYAVNDELVEIKSKKKFIEGLGDLGDDASKFMKINRLEVKDKRDLRALFDHLNSIATPGS